MVLKEQIKIVLGDSNEILRNALATYINNTNEYCVLHHHNNGKELIKNLKVSLPDIVIMDLDLKGLNGYEALTIIKNRFPDVKVILFSNIENDQVIKRLFNSGASAVILKTASIQQLNSTIKEVSLNGFSISKLQELIMKKKDKIYPNNNTIKFSDREIQVMEEVCNGFSNKQISQKLFITSSTVDFHKQRIYKKSNTSNVLDLFKFAVRNKIVKVD